MPRVLLTKEAFTTIRSHAREPFGGVYEEVGEKFFSVELGMDTIERLADHTLKGESLSDAIIRLFNKTKH